MPSLARLAPSRGSSGQLDSCHQLQLHNSEYVAFRSVALGLRGSFLSPTSNLHVFLLPFEGTWELLSEHRNLEFCSVHLWIPWAFSHQFQLRTCGFSLQLCWTSLAEGALGILVPQTLLIHWHSSSVQAPLKIVQVCVSGCQRKSLDYPGPL